MSPTARVNDMSISVGPLGQRPPTYRTSCTAAQAAGKVTDVCEKDTVLWGKRYCLLGQKSVTFWEKTVSFPVDDAKSENSQIKVKIL